jgi:hypothetical protein
MLPLAPVIVIVAFDLMRGGGSAPEEIFREFEFFHKKNSLLDDSSSWIVA